MLVSEAPVVVALDTRYEQISLYVMTNMESPQMHAVLARTMRVLSAPARLRIVELLKGRALCVNALTARIGLTQGAVSQHLRVLRDAGIVVREKRGYYVHYMIDDAKLREVREAVCAFLSGGGGSTGKPKGEKRCARGRSAARGRKR